MRADLVRRARELHSPCRVPHGVSGDWRVEPWEVDKALSEHWTEQMQTFPLPYREFSAPGSYTRLMHGAELVMSNIDAEIVEHVGFIERASGSVLITGLGLGVLPLALLAFGKVRHIDIVEVEQNVIDLVWPHVADERMTLHKADAYTWEPDRSWDFAYHDLFYGGMDAKACIDKLKTRYHATHQEAWGERFFA